MTSSISSGQTPDKAVSRSELWVWWVCGLLLLASTINYMDRQTLANTSERITREFKLSEEQYGSLETAFGLAFAVGASIFGFIADKTSVRWLYPAVLLLWSTMGFMTGLVETYTGLFYCRLFLGLFEAGHWPCALKTTQRLLPSSKRTLGNSVLQSGTAIGAMVTPLIIKSLITDQPGSWRPAFQIVGAVGAVWAVLWLATIKPNDIDGASDYSETETSNRSITDETAEIKSTDSVQSSFLNVLFSRKFLVLVIVVISINLCWHQFRVWMQKFLIKGRGYDEIASLNVNFWFNVMTDIGCLTAGFTSALLARRGMTAHVARCWVFGTCSLLVATGGLIPFLEKGPVLIGVLMTVGIGSLGLFPCYYAFTQELSVKHQGKVSGTLGTIAWIFPSLWHREFGRWVDTHKTYDIGMCLASLMPLVAIFVLVVFWPKEEADAIKLDT